MNYEIDEKILNKEYYAIQGLFEAKWNVLEKYQTENQAVSRIQELITEAAKKGAHFNQKRIVYIKEIKEFSVKIDTDNVLDMF